MSFKIGDRVRIDEVMYSQCNRTWLNNMGTIIKLDWAVAIEFDEPFPYGHDCEGNTKYGHGYWFPPDCVKHLLKRHKFSSLTANVANNE